MCFKKVEQGRAAKGEIAKNDCVTDGDQRSQKGSRKQKCRKRRWEGQFSIIRRGPACPLSFVFRFRREHAQTYVRGAVASKERVHVAQMGDARGREEEGRDAKGDIEETIV